MVFALQFLTAPPDSSQLYSGSYDSFWVVVSILLAILASFAALNAASRIKHLHEHSSQLVWALISAITMGVGIWSMHFIGMLALSLPCRVYYDPYITLLSMLPSILASGVALGIVWHHGGKHFSPFLSSILLGAGIGAMHYTGMSAMRLQGLVYYDLYWFILSIVVAVALSYLALRVKSTISGSGKLSKAVVAVILGGAVSGMHYTAMFAAYFVKDDSHLLLSRGVSANTIAILIAFTSVFLALAVLALATASRNREITKQLRDGEERWKFALEGAGDGVWDWSPQINEAVFSKRWKEMLGYAEHEFPDTPTQWAEHIHHDDKHRALSTIQGYFAGNQPFFVVEYRMRCKDGSWKWILARGKIVSRDADGMPLRMIGTHTDISDRKLAEESLQRSELKFRTVFDSSGDAMMLLDENVFLDCNKAALTLFGCKTVEQFCAMAPGDMSPPEQPCGTSSLILAKHLIVSAMEKGSVRFEWLHKRVDTGVIFPAEVLLSAMELNGKPIIQVTIRDIAERKKAETELRIAATAFESQEGILVTDVNTVILRVNRAFTQITGYSAGEVVGKTPGILHSGLQSPEFYADMWACIEKTGSWEGEIWNRRKNDELFLEYLTVTAVKNSDGMVSNYVATLTDITLSKAAEEEIHSLAFFDPLTGLPNRRLLLDRLNQALILSHRTGRKGALLFIDMDNFKTLNDTLGYDMGDLLLQQVAKRLAQCVREGDTVSRFGGDEFVVMLEDLSEHEFEAATETEIIGEAILNALNQPYLLVSHNYRSTPSIGAALFNGHIHSIDELFKQADIAMYQAKNSGRNALRFFDPQMQTNINTRVELEADLRLAETEKQFQLYYQPQVYHDGRIVGAEVLIRWLHPTRGLVSSADFIPLTEETGLILSIGQWLLETACEQIKHWQASEKTRHLKLAVNVSARQFHETDFVEHVTDLLRRTGINPELLKLELTESIVLDDIEDTINKMNSLREIGVRFSIDDFGTGYSSLSYLTQLPLDQLKIDQSFIRNIGVKSSDSVIVQTIIGMAKNLGMEVIAEGVETEVQRAFLEQHGCLIYQGYLFRQPLPLDVFESLFIQKDNIESQNMVEAVIKVQSEPLVQSA